MARINSPRNEEALLLLCVTASRYGSHVRAMRDEDGMFCSRCWLPPKESHDARLFDGGQMNGARFWISTGHEDSRSQCQCRQLQGGGRGRGGGAGMKRRGTHAASYALLKERCVVGVLWYMRSAEQRCGDRALTGTRRSKVRIAPQLRAGLHFRLARQLKIARKTPRRSLPQRLHAGPRTAAGGNLHQLP